MTTASVNRRDGGGTTTLALRPAGVCFRKGKAIAEIDAGAHGLAEFAREVERLSPLTKRHPRRRFASRPSSPLFGTCAPKTCAGRGLADGFTLRLATDAAPEMRGDINVARSRRGLSVAEMLRSLLARERPDDPGAPP